MELLNGDVHYLLLCDIFIDPELVDELPADRRHCRLVVWEDEDQQHPGDRISFIRKLSFNAFIKGPRVLRDCARMRVTVMDGSFWDAEGSLINASDQSKEEGNGYFVHLLRYSHRKRRSSGGTAGGETVGTGGLVGSLERNTVEPSRESSYAGDGRMANAG